MEKLDKVLPVIAKQGSSSDEHEDRCERCGVGCHASVNIDDRDIIVEGLHCKFLERTGDEPLENLGRGRFQCSVYEDRLEVAPWCVHTDYASVRGWLRLGCPYAAEKGVSKGKERLSPEEYDNMWPRIFHELIRTNWHDYVSYQSFIDNELKKYSPGPNWVAVPGDEPNTIAFEIGDE